MTVKKQIPTSHVYYTDESKLKEFLVDKKLSQICSTHKDKPKGTTTNECYTEEDKSGCVHKNINRQKYAKNETEYEEYSVTDKEPI